MKHCTSALIIGIIIAALIAVLMIGNRAKKK